MQKHFFYVELVKLVFLKKYSFIIKVKKINIMEVVIIIFNPIRNIFILDNIFIHFNILFHFIISNHFNIFNLVIIEIIKLFILIFIIIKVF